MSRAAWLASLTAVGSLCGVAVGLGCSAGAESPSSAQSASTNGASTFACGETTCQVSTDYCSVSQSGCGNYIYDCEPRESNDSGGDGLVNFPGSCLTSPTCACAIPSDDSITCTAVTGGVELTRTLCSNGGGSSACYGSPPARLGRIARTRKATRTKFA